MLLSRIFPVLLLKSRGLYKGIKFKNHQYIGDPINTVKLFNDKEVDELAILDIEATLKGIRPEYDYLESIASEAFMPLAYGGGIKSVEDAKNIFSIGFEKIIIGTEATKNIDLIKKLSEQFGSQSITISVDIKKNIFGNYIVSSACGTKKSNIKLTEYINILQKNGAGEIILNNIDNDGKMLGYDTKIIKEISDICDIPLIALGGAGNIQDLRDALISGAHAVAAGSMFVYSGKQKGILINYLSDSEINKVLEF